MQNEVTALLQEQQSLEEVVQPPADAAIIDAEAQQLETQFGATLPADYRAFLTRMNGTDHNSLVLYGAGKSPEHPGPGGFWQGLAAANTLWREGPGHERYLILGETSMDLLTVDLDGSHPALRDKVSSDVNEEFASVADAVATLVARYI